MFLFLSLAFLKRFTEVSAHGRRRPTASRSAGGDISAATASGSAPWAGRAAISSVLVLALYINSDQVVALYRTPLFLWLVCPLLLFWTSRMWLLAHRGRIHDDPIVATVRDPVSYVTRRARRAGAVLAL